MPDLEVDTAPTVWPVSVDDLKAQARIVHSDDDALLLGYIKVATRQVERYVQRSLLSQTWKLYLDAFPKGLNELGCLVDKPIRLLKPPVISVEHIYYTDTDGDEQEFEDFQEKLTGASPLVAPDYQMSWPQTRDVFNAVRVEYTAGYGAAATDVPEDIIQAVKLLATTYFELRDLKEMEKLECFPVLKMLLNPFRILRF